MLVKMFELFDGDRNGRIDIKELATGLSVLAGGNWDAKTKCAFTLYDLAGDGQLSVGEMVHYLHAVYRVMYKAEPSTKELGGGSRRGIWPLRPRSRPSPRLTPTTTGC